jgi:dTDP-4-dehydrorhamnose 3,5-epimerase
VRFFELPVVGAFRVEIERRSDERGFFARTFCEREFRERGLVDHFTQTSVSFNIHRGTVRGMHFSVGPNAETKLVRCTSGELYDVLVDLRPTSASYLLTFGVMLSAASREALYIPTGVAHGFQTLKDATEILYQIDFPYDTSAARGIRWNDPAVRVEWPEPIRVISERDLQFSDWNS